MAASLAVPLAALLAALLTLAAACAQPDGRAGACAPAVGHGLSGRWTWLGDVGRGAMFCLEQRGPVRVGGALTLAGGARLTVAGAVSPDGAVFLHATGANARAVTLVGRRRRDTLTVDWAGGALAPRGGPREVYAPGTVVRAAAGAASDRAR